MEGLWKPVTGLLSVGYRTRLGRLVSTVSCSGPPSRSSTPTRVQNLSLTGPKRRSGRGRIDPLVNCSSVDILPVVTEVDTTPKSLYHVVSRNGYPSRGWSLDDRDYIPLVVTLFPFQVPTRLFSDATPLLSFPIPVSVSGRIGIGPARIRRGNRPRSSGPVLRSGGTVGDTSSHVEEGVRRRLHVSQSLVVRVGGMPVVPLL